MVQDSNFYRIYQLAYSDRTHSLKALILFAIIFSLFSISSLLFLGGINTSNLKLVFVSFILWLLTFSVFNLFILVAPKVQLFFGSLVFSISLFTPLLLLGIFDFYLLYIYLAIVFLLMISILRFKGEADSLINLNLPRLISKVSFIFTLILFIIIGTLIYYNHRDINFLVNGFFSNIIDKYFNALGGTFNFNDTIDGIVTKYLNQQINIFGSNTNNKTLNQLLLSQTRETLSNMFNIPLTGKETIVEAIKKYFILHWANFTWNIKIIFIIILLSIIFSVLALVNYVINIIFVILTWLLLKLLVTIKYINIKMVGVEKEELSLI